MKSDAKHARTRLNLDEVDLEEAKARYAIAKRRMEIDHGAAEAYNNVKQSIVDGDYSAAEAAASKAKSLHPTMRTTAQAEETKQALAIKNERGGVCTLGECCVTSYKGDACKVEATSMCKSAGAENALFWKPMVGFEAELDQTVVNSATADQLTKKMAVNRTVHVKAKWTLNDQKHQSLEVQICGRFTKYGNQGASVCFPKGDEGIPIGELFSVPKGECIRNADFVDVIRARVADRVNKGMDAAEKLEKAKTDVDKTAQIDEITEAVSRAIGGAFKGRLGGIVREDNELDRTQLLSFIQESSHEDWEALLVPGGSFKISYIAKQADFNGLKKVLDPAQGEVSMLDQ